jgi:hypothetical protein
MKINLFQNIKTHNFYGTNEPKKQNIKKANNDELWDLVLLSTVLLYESDLYGTSEIPPNELPKEPVNENSSGMKFFFGILLLICGIKLCYDLYKRFSNNKETQKLNVSA